MIRNYFTVAIRNFRRNKIFTLINILGLALGVTCAMLIYMLVNLHLSFDTFHDKAGRIYRVVTDIYFEGEMHTPGTPVPLIQSLRDEIPQIEAVAEFYDIDDVVVTVEELGVKKKFKYDELVCAYVSPTFFQIFDFKWLNGNPSGLNEINKIVLREELANKLFPDIDPIGQQLKINNEIDVTVVGILEDGPKKSDVWRAGYISFSTFEFRNKKRMTQWGSVSSDHQTFVSLLDSADPQEINQSLSVLVEKYHQEDAGEGPDGGNAWIHKLQPLSDVHFNSDYNGEVDKSLIWALALVGLFLIITACINFVNLATAQALGRSKEVGVRKVVGGNRVQLFSQFMIETGVIVLISILLATALVSPILPVVNELTGSDLTFKLLEDHYLWSFLIIAFIGVTLLSGIYPAMVLAGFKPALAIKGEINSQTLGGFNVRRTLVVAQFAISQLLLISVAVMTMQTNYLSNLDFGFNKDSVVVFSLPETESDKLKILESELDRISGVERISFSRATAASSSHNWTTFHFDGNEEEDKSQILTRPADAHYLDTYEIELAAGRNLLPSDTVREYLVNEKFVAKMGLSSPNEAIGKSLEIWDKEGPIVGVVKNYYQSPANFASFEPLAIMTRSELYRNVNVKISNADVPRTLAAIEKVWTDAFPDNYYEYDFFDERIKEFYEMESILLALIRSFCFVAIVIGCLGLYGLVTFLVARRLKEIGVRKVLGASVSSILGLFGKEFFRLISIAFLIAGPIGYLVMDEFLSDYRSAIELGAGVFVGAVLVTMVIAVITVGWHSWQAAQANPAEVLKSE